MSFRVRFSVLFIFLCELMIYFGFEFIFEYFKRSIEIPVLEVLFYVLVDLLLVRLDWLWHFFNFYFINKIFKSFPTLMSLCKYKHYKYYTNSIILTLFIFIFSFVRLFLLFQIYTYFKFFQLANKTNVRTYTWPSIFHIRQRILKRHSIFID